MIADKITLEFDKITDLLTDYAFTEQASEYLANLIPSSDEAVVLEQLERTDEALVLLYKIGQPPLANIYNINPHLRRVKLSGSLNAKELRQIAMHLLAVKLNKNYLINAKAENVEVTFFKDEIDALVYFKDLYQRINLCVDEDAQILDSASTKLSGIRRKIIQTQGKLEEKLT